MQCGQSFRWPRRCFSRGAGERREGQQDDCASRERSKLSWRLMHESVSVMILSDLIRGSAGPCRGIVMILMVRSIPFGMHTPGPTRERVGPSKSRDDLSRGKGGVRTRVCDQKGFLARSMRKTTQSTEFIARRGGAGYPAPAATNIIFLRAPPCFSVLSVLKSCLYQTTLLPNRQESWLCSWLMYTHLLFRNGREAENRTVRMSQRGSDVFPIRN